MAKRSYQRKPETPGRISYDTPLPTHVPVANYYRQSTTAQVGNISTDIQTIDMAEYLKRLGWPEDKIIMIDMDAGVSGTTRIDEREGMSQLFQLITTGKVGAVSCQDEDRLFRDVTQIQVNIFIEACKQHKVLVITPSMVYNFHHEQMGIFHARQFRWKSEVAAEYISSYVLGKLYQAKQRLTMQGRWAGPPIPPGFMIDDRKMLPDGRPNENWRKFAIFEPYAEVVREYWNLFLGFGGQLRKTLRHIRKHGPYFPDPELCKPPVGFRVAYRLQQNQGKWCPSKSGLRYMLTNAMYLGHWVTDNRVVVWDNHPAIIDQDVFMRAFHYLSDLTLEGLPNPNFIPNPFQTRPSLDEQRPEERPLCLGLLVSQDIDGTWIPTGSIWDSKSNYFAYRHYSKITDISLWQKRAACVDDTVTELLLKKLRATFDFDVWKAALETFSEDFERERRLKQAQMDQLRRAMDNLLMALATLQNPQMIAAADKQYTEAQREHERLKQELEASRQEALRMQQIERLKESCEEVVSDWPEMTADEKRQVVHLFVSRIEATRVDGHALHLRLYWQDASESEVTLPREAGAGNFWLTKELDYLVELMQSETDQIKIAAAFPDRPWEKLRNKYRKHSSVLGKYVKVKFSPRPVRERESYNDYLERTGQKPATTYDSESHSATSRRRNRRESGLFREQSR